MRRGRVHTQSKGAALSQRNGSPSASVRRPGTHPCASVTICNSLQCVTLRVLSLLKNAGGAKMKQNKFIAAAFVGIFFVTAHAHADCTYADKKYGDNSSTKHDDGIVYVCKGNAWGYEKTPISVESAMIACSGRTFYHTQKIKNECDGKQICNVDVTEWAKNSCKDLIKLGTSLTIIYHCNKAKSVPISGSAQSLSQPLDSTIQLACTAYD